MKTKLILGLLLTVLSIIMISIAVKSCKLKPEPNQKIIYEKITKKSDSVGVVVVVRAVDDTTGLHKLEAFKKRIAAATIRRQLDSLARLKNNR